MIRQSQEGEPSKNRRNHSTDEPKRQGGGAPEIIAAVSDDDELDPADFFDPEDLGIGPRR